MEQAFEEAVHLILNRWTALQIAIDNQLGGPGADRIGELREHVVEFFRLYGKDVQPYELADNFTAFFDEVFHIGLEDGSPDQVGHTLCSIFSEIVLKNNMEPLDILRDLCQTQTKGSVLSTHVGENSDSDDSDDDMDTNIPSEPPKREPILDEDGFELVQRKKKGSR